MLVNSSSSSNASLPPPSLSSSSNMHSSMHSCLTSTVGTLSITAFTITSIFILLPVCIFVLYLGLQRWRQQRSITTMSHSDLFTYNMVITELLSVLASTLTCCSVYIDHAQMTMVGMFLYIFNVYGQTLFHILTCVERYLAVVHPITYLSLRKAKGIRIRNITIGCVWLLCFAGTGFMSVLDHVGIFIVNMFVMGFSLIVVSFCSLSVLCVLIRPGPGEGGGGRQQVDQSKLRAFYTIMAILGALLIRFGGYTLSVALLTLSQLGEAGRCGLWLSTGWFILPSSLVLPLLFLHRAGKLLCCKNNNESGRGSD